MGTVELTGLEMMFRIACIKPAEHLRAGMVSPLDSNVNASMNARISHALLIISLTSSKICQLEWCTENMS